MLRSSPSVRLRGLVLTVLPRLSWLIPCSIPKIVLAAPCISVNSAPVRPGMEICSSSSFSYFPRPSFVSRSTRTCSWTKRNKERSCGKFEEAGCVGKGQPGDVKANLSTYYRRVNGGLNAICAQDLVDQAPFVDVEAEITEYALRFQDDRYVRRPTLRSSGDVCRCL